MGKTKKVLFIYGKGGLASEVRELVNLLNKWDSKYFIDDSDDNLDPNTMSFLLLKSKLDDFKDSALEFVVAVGEPKLRKVLYDKILSLKLIKPTSLIHPSAFIASSAKLNEGVIINYNCFISAEVNIENNVYLQPMSSIGHNSIIHSHSVISTFASIAGNCSVGECSYIGMNASVIQRATIGDNTIVGMGTIIMKSFGSNLTIIGNPGRVISNNEENRVFK
jgi:sugar O-acyltransferase (sialic acid O-acetyltransferase NeuD family)